MDLAEYTNITIRMEQIDLVIECEGLLRQSGDAEPVGVDENGVIETVSTEAILETTGGRATQNGETRIFPAGVYRLGRNRFDKIGEIVT